MTNQQAKIIVAALAYAIYHNNFPTTVISDTTYTLSNIDDQNLDNPQFYFSISSLGTINVENRGGDYRVEYDGEYIDINGGRGNIQQANLLGGSQTFYNFNISSGEVSFKSSEGQETIRVWR